MEKKIDFNRLDEVSKKQDRFMAHGDGIEIVSDQDRLREAQENLKKRYIERQVKNGRNKDN